MAKMNATTIHGAISAVLSRAPRPMAPKEIFDQIVAADLYRFKAVDPLHVVISQLRRHTAELDFPSSDPAKYYSITDDGRFYLLDRPVRRGPPRTAARPIDGASGERDAVSVHGEEGEGKAGPTATAVSHTEIQYRLLQVGSDLGLSVWAPVGDRGKGWAGKRISSIRRMLDELPVNFDEPSRRVIQNIDVLWIDKRAIVAGFEVEHTSSVYSGLLRMSDLLSMQPNIVIKFYLVAPDARFDKFAREIARPTFSSLEPPLHTICRFLPYSLLLEYLAHAAKMMHHLKPGFLDDISRSCGPAEELRKLSIRRTMAVRSKEGRRTKQ